MTEGSEDAQDAQARAVRVMRVVTLAIGAVVAGLTAYVVGARFAFPVDAEWMVGSVRDTVDRVRQGLPIYAPPSGTFVAFLYTPLYYWVSALVARVTSTFLACKLVSLGATIGAAWGVGRIARALGASRFWTAIAVLLEIGCFSFTLFFYDLERVDPLSAAVVVAGVAVLLDRSSGAADRPALARAAAGGALLGLSFFAKQPGLFAFLGATAGLFVAGERRRALAAGAAGALVLVGLGAYLEASTGGWWRYYCITLPRTHGMEPRLISTFFVVDAPKAFALTAGSVTVVAWAARAALARRRGEVIRWQDVAFGAIVLAGMVGAFSLRAHRGGWANVLLAWTPLACVAAAVAASRVEAKAAGTTAARLVSLLLLAGTSLQFLSFVFDPNDVAPDPADVRDADKLRALVRKLEEEGDVVVTPKGGLTKNMHYHSAALFDVLRAGDPAPPDHLAALRERRYAAILVDAPFEVHCKQQGCRAIDEAMARNYFVACRLEEKEHTGMAGFDARPRWVLRPRKQPLEGGDRAFWDHRRRVEMGLAAMREQGRGQGADPEIDDAIEQIAAEPDPRWR